MSLIYAAGDALGEKGGDKVGERVGGKVGDGLTENQINRKMVSENAKICRKKRIIYGQKAVGRNTTALMKIRGWLLKSSLFYYFPRNSSAKEGTDNIVKHEKPKLGKFEMQLLAYTQMNPMFILATVPVLSMSTERFDDSPGGPQPV